MQATRHPDDRGQNARGLSGGTGHRRLQEAGGLLAHEAAELRGDCVLGISATEGQTPNPGLNPIGFARSTRRRSAAETPSATASAAISARERPTTTHTHPPRRSNPHRARRTAIRPPIAVSFLGGFRAPEGRLRQGEQRRSTSPAGAAPRYCRWATQPARSDRTICFEADPSAKARRTARPGATAAPPDRHALAETMPSCITRFSRELNRKQLSQPNPDRISLTAAWRDQSTRRVHWEDVMTAAISPRPSEPTRLLKRPINNTAACTSVSTMIGQRALSRSFLPSQKAVPANSEL